MHLYIGVNVFQDLVSYTGAKPEAVTSSSKCRKLYTSLHSIILEEWNFQKIHAMK
jgi:hypothetical protein